VKRAIINLDHVLYMFFQLQVANTVPVTFKRISVTQIITCKTKKKKRRIYTMFCDLTGSDCVMKC